MMIADLTVLTTRLPYVDRGTLSQAWYDALNLGPKSSAAALHGTQERPSATLQMPVKAALTRQSAKAVPLQSARSATSSLQPRSIPIGAPKVHPPVRNSFRCISALSAVHRPALQVRNSTAIVQLPDGERICLIIHGGAHGLRLVALCSPALRTRVAHALAHVRALFAERGVACNMHVGGIERD